MLYEIIIGSWHVGATLLFALVALRALCVIYAGAFLQGLYAWHDRVTGARPAKAEADFRCQHPPQVHSRTTGLTSAMSPDSNDQRCLCFHVLLSPSNACHLPAVPTHVHVEPTLPTLPTCCIYIAYMYYISG